MAITEVGEYFSEVLFDKIGLVSLAVFAVNSTIGECHNNEIDEGGEKTINE